MNKLNIAIIGASESHWESPTQKMIAQKVILRLLSNNDDTIISGHSPKDGVDIWVEDFANRLKMKTQIFPPETRDWQGYMKRNKQIAEACDILIDIEPEGRTHSGGMWTLEQAKILGKSTIKIEIGSC